MKTTIKYSVFCILLIFLFSNIITFGVSAPSAFSVIVKTDYMNDENIVISWTASSNATKYGLSVYDSNSKLVFDNYVNGTTKDIGKLAIGKYKILMKAYNDSGTSPTTNAVYFNVVATSTLPSPSAFSVIVKTDYENDENIVISWTASTNATKYGLSVYDSNSKLIFDNYVNGTTKDIGKLAIGKYKVLMKAYNDSGTSPTTNAVYFNVIKNEDIFSEYQSSDWAENDIKALYNENFIRYSSFKRYKYNITRLEFIRLMVDLYEHITNT